MQECNDALTTFKKAQEIMEDKRDRRYKEFVKFFSTAVGQKGEHKLADESVFVYEYSCFLFDQNVIRAGVPNA